MAGGRRDRLRGFIPGGILVGALLLLFATVSFGAAMVGEARCWQRRHTR